MKAFLDAGFKPVAPEAPWRINLGEFYRALLTRFNVDFATPGPRPNAECLSVYKSDVEQWCTEQGVTGVNVFVDHGVINIGPECG